jgi:hypothetical protein
MCYSKELNDGVRRSFVRNGNPIHGWEHAAEDENALWRFERLSVSAADIGLALYNNAHKIDGLKPFEKHDMYVERGFFFLL